MTGEQKSRQSERKCPACGDVENFDGEWCRECGHVEGPTVLIGPEMVPMVPCDEAAIGRAVDALLADSGLPRFGPYRTTIERRVRLVFDAAKEPAGS